MTDINYKVIDTHTKQVVRTFDSSRKAHNYADRQDLDYGAVRFVVKCDANPSDLIGHMLKYHSRDPR